MRVNIHKHDVRPVVRFVLDMFYTVSLGSRDEYQLFAGAYSNDDFPFESAHFVIVSTDR